MVEMRRRTALLILFVALLTSGCSVFSGKTAGDIVVLPLGNEVSVTEGSAVYALPLTVFEFVITADKHVEVPGPYALYAEEMTGLDNVIMAENESWSLADVRLNTIEELDPSQFYVIEGTTIMQSNMLALRKNGLVLDINPDLYDRTASNDHPDGFGHSGLLFPDRGVYEYGTTRTDTAYRLVRADTAFIRVPYLVQKKKGMTVAEEAREAADRLLELREGRHMILTGETNIFPQDGAAIDEINRLEREYTALFAGKTWTERRHFRVWVTPDLPMAGSKTTIFTFSESHGVNTNADGAGEPVQMEIVPSGKTRALKLVTRPASKKKEQTVNDKLYYRVPDVAEITVSLGEEKLLTARKLIYQFGSTVALPSNIIIGR